MSPAPSPGLRLVAVDAFTSVPFSGNGAAVVLLEQPAEDNWMQALAAELQQSETAFLWLDGSRWRLRWFTPSCEVPLCGHATLAAALALHHWGLLPLGSPLQLRAGDNSLRVEVISPGQACIDLPAPALLPRKADGWMADLLGQPPLAQWTSALQYGVLLLRPEFELTALDPHHPSWRLGPEKAWVLMQAAAAPHDYQLRFFAPGLGLSEDPVTGSAHALVAPWWCEQLQRPSVEGWQPSHRPGGVHCEPLSSGMIRLRGSGVLVWDARLPWPPERLSVDRWRR